MGTLDHFLNATFPASTAASKSSGVATGTGGFAFLVAGLIPCRVFEVETSLPLMMLEKPSNVTLAVPLAAPLEPFVVDGAMFSNFFSCGG